MQVSLLKVSAWDCFLEEVPYLSVVFPLLSE